MSIKIEPVNLPTPEEQLKGGSCAVERVDGKTEGTENIVFHIQPKGWEMTVDVFPDIPDFPKGTSLANVLETSTGKDFGFLGENFRLTATAVYNRVNVTLYRALTDSGVTQKPIKSFTFSVNVGITRAEAVKLLKAQQENGDTETAHAVADSIICDLLETLGYGDVVAEYRKVEKWYA